MARHQDRMTSMPEPPAAGRLDGRADMFRAAFEVATDAMMVIHANGDPAARTVGFVNRAMATLTGYPEAELLGRSLRMLDGPDSHPNEEGRRERGLLDWGTYTGEAVHYRKDGTSYLANWAIAVIPGEGSAAPDWLVVARDETKQRHAFAALADVEQRHRALLEGIPHLVWQSRDGGDWLAASPQWRAFTGQSEEASRGAGWRAMIDPDDLAVTDEAWRAALDTSVMTVDHRIRRHDGVFRWFQTRALPIPADASRGRDRLWIGTSTDVDELCEAEEQIRYLAFHDVLTTAGNRAMLQEVLGRMTAGAPGGVPFSVLYLDVDDFKGVNDQLGHRGGDEFLREMARQLMSRRRDGDVVARIGGDEFVVVLARSGPDEAVQLADEIRSRLAEPLAIAGQEFRVGASIGIASWPEDGGDADELLRRADLALFAAKTDGGGGLRRFEPAMEAALQERLALRTGLSLAIKRDELAVAYQAVCEPGTGKVQAYEALARWTHPERGALRPDLFIPIAEESGQIEAIGEWMLMHACRDATSERFGGCRVAVNLSPAQFRSGGLVQTIRRALDEAGLAPNRLELEVTERLLMGSGEEVDRALREIKGIGVRISLDDFGTGYSNLGYLCRFPFDQLKIDQSFVRQMIPDGGARLVVSSIIALAHNLRMEVTAEGVETREQLEMLREMGCDQVQGFLLSRPVPISCLGASR